MRCWLDTMEATIMAFNIAMLALFLVISLLMAAQIGRMQKQAIERGFAKYDPTTGRWRWRERDE